MTAIGTNFGANVGEVVGAAIAKGTTTTAGAAPVTLKGLNTTGLDSVTISMLDKAQKQGKPLELLRKFIENKRNALRQSAEQMRMDRRIIAQNNVLAQVNAAKAKDYIANSAFNPKNAPGIKGFLNRTWALVKGHPVAATAIALAAVGLGYWALKKPSTEEAYKEAA